MPSEATKVIHFEKFQSKHTKDWRWRLRAKNGRIVAISGEGYRNEEDCDKGMRIAMSTSAETPVEIVRR